jgi:hypothetical protein
MDTKLEVAMVPVTDVDRGKAFDKSLGWRLDADFGGGDSFRAVQLTPPRSAPVIFGSFDSFRDPDRNNRTLQEPTTRLPGR